MTDLIADGIEINIEDGKWRLYNIEGSHSLSPFFSTMRGARLLSYVAEFGESRNLPGTVLSADYVLAVIVGFDEKRQRWLLGIQVLLSNEEKPRFAELVRWPQGDNEPYGVDSHRAGRVLAEYIGCPLKLFGVKKAAIAQSSGRTVSRPTGPLEPHRRTDLDATRVRMKAEAIKLPIQREGIWLGGSRSNVTLRLSRDSEQNKAGGESPAFNQCLIDKDGHTVRLMPPTGLFGAFLGPQGRTLKFEDVRNVELRHTLLQDSAFRKEADGTMVDVTQTQELFGIYLTLATESVLLAQLHHMATSELARHRAKTKTMIDNDYDSEKEMAYLRQHQAEQKHRDAAAEFMEASALVIAAAMARPLVQTDMGDDLA